MKFKTKGIVRIRLHRKYTGYTEYKLSIYLEDKKERTDYENFLMIICKKSI